MKELFTKVKGTYEIQFHISLGLAIASVLIAPGFEEIGHREHHVEGTQQDLWSLIEGFSQPTVTQQGRSRYLKSPVSLSCLIPQSLAWDPHCWSPTRYCG